MQALLDLTSPGQFTEGMDSSTSTGVRVVQQGNYVARLLRSAGAVICVLAVMPQSGASEQGSASFAQEVRPILSATCFRCHGPDDEHREADLRLDTAEGGATVFGGGISGSAAWERITSDDPDLVMPPPDSHIEFTDSQKAILESWIREGAPYEQHWAFVAPSGATADQLESPPWARTRIDRFVHDKLKATGLTPSSDADAETLLRRVTFDLTGLPPTPEELDEFLADPSDAAYERVLDRLLASPHFGERMAVRWLDAARYGDTSVFHADGPRDMWPWRDWLIRNYNANTPFDQMTIHQLAGDLIESPTVESQLATGFLRNNATTDEGGAIAEEFRVEYAVDRVKTVSMAYLGLSMECAQCHNHKYDPISQEDYYRFFAFFNQASDPGMQTRNGNQAPLVDVHDADRIRQAAKLEQEREQLQLKADELRKDSEPAFREWLTEQSRLARADAAGDSGVSLQGQTGHIAFEQPAADGFVNRINNEVGKNSGKVTSATGRQGQAAEFTGDGRAAFANTGDFDGSHGLSYGAWINPAGKADGAPLARMQSGGTFRGYDIHLTGGIIQIHLIHQWPTDAIKVRSKKKLPADQWSHVFVSWNGEKKADAIRLYVNGEEWEHSPEQDRLKGDLKTNTPLTFGGRTGGSGFRGRVDEARFFDRALNAEEVDMVFRDTGISMLLAKSDNERTESENAALREHYLMTVHQEYAALAERITAMGSQAADLRKPIATSMVMKDNDSLRQTFVLMRGNYASPDKERPVGAGVPVVFEPLPQRDRPANRLDLAEWLVSGRHPLTARVAVNRYWSMFFGEGLVRTIEDFGAQGDFPSHPALLDYLADRFVRSGWDIKAVIREIVTSSVYRQASAVQPNAAEVDPENRLLAYAPRFRLQAEFIRDQALAASGLLNRKIGGPGVKPYQPPGLWNEVSLSGNVRFVQDHGDKLYRRSMYTYWKRSSPAPSMTVFDAPTREKCAMRRGRTNTPLQALVVLNDPQFVEAARFLAENALIQEESVRAQINDIYRRCTGRRPATATLDLLESTYRDERNVFEDNGERAEQLLSVGEAKRSESLNAADHAAMTIVAGIILNLDASLTRN